MIVAFVSWVLWPSEPRGPMTIKAVVVDVFGHWCYEPSRPSIVLSTYFGVKLRPPLAIYSKTSVYVELLIRLLLFFN